MGRTGQLLPNLDTWGASYSYVPQEVDPTGNLFGLYLPTAGSDVSSVAAQVPATSHGYAVDYIPTSVSTANPRNGTYHLRAPYNDTHATNSYRIKFRSDVNCPSGRTDYSEDWVRNYVGSGAVVTVVAYVSASVLGTTDPQVRLSLIAYDDAQASLGSLNGTYVQPGATNTFYEHSLSMVIPSGTVFCVAILNFAMGNFFTGGALAGTTCNLDVADFTLTAS